MTPDLVIVNPGAAQAIYSNLAAEFAAKEPPLWCRLIAGYIRDNGFSVEIIDAEAAVFSPAELPSIIVGQRHPKLVAIVSFGHQPSASTQQMEGASKAAKDIKRLSPNQKIIMVGGHVAALPERTLREEAIDYACNGEGMETIRGILKGDAPETIRGLVWRDGDKIISNPRAELPSLDKLHGNAWDLLPMRQYVSHNWQAFGNLAKRRPYASIYTSLNCPFKCSFCCISAPFGNNRYLMRSPQAVVSEIMMLNEKYGVETIKIIDEMFILNERHYTEICEELIASGLGAKINIWAYARVDTVKPHTLSMLRRAGIRWLALGIESGSKHVRDGAEKALKNDDIIGVVKEIQAAGINVIGNFIFGLPDDDAASMQQTLDLAVELNCEFANFYSAMAYPGSKLYDDAIANGQGLPETWLGYSQHAYETHPLNTEHLTAAEVLRFRDEAFDIYFKNPRYLEMVREKFGAETLAHVQDMTRHKIKRKLLENAA